VLHPVQDAVAVEKHHPYGKNRYCYGVFVEEKT